MRLWCAFATSILRFIYTKLGRSFLPMSGSKVSTVMRLAILMLSTKAEAAYSLSLSCSMRRWRVVCERTSLIFILR